MFWHLGKLAEELLGDDAVYIGEIFEHFELFVSDLQLSWKCSKKKNSNFAFSTCIPWLSASSRKLSRLTWPSFEALSYRSKRSKKRSSYFEILYFHHKIFCLPWVFFFPLTAFATTETIARLSWSVGQSHHLVQWSLCFMYATSYKAAYMGKIQLKVKSKWYFWVAFCGGMFPKGQDVSDCQYFCKNACIAGFIHF